MDQNIPVLQQPRITPERDRQSQREHDRLGRLQMTSPTRRNRRRAAHNNQDGPPPPVPQPNFMPANEPQAAPVPQPFAWQPPPHFPYQPLPVGQYPGLPRNAIAHVLHAHRPPPVDHDAVLNVRINAATNNRLHQRNLRRQQGRQEIRQQVQAELMAAGMEPPHAPHIPNEPARPAPPVPPVYAHIHYEGAVNYRNDLLQRQAQEAFHREQVQHQLQQQEAERLHREAQEDLAVFDLLQQGGNNLNAHQAQQLNDMIARHAQDAHREQRQEAALMNNPLHHFAPNPAPPLHAPPEPDYDQFNIHTGGIPSTADPATIAAAIYAAGSSAAANAAANTAADAAADVAAGR
ncbi:hypothetical protein F4604DRAFT_1907670 [Suillus subluteus]|nr:hypothetical protein F4604DRAFT_1907670 [Suillus subluteus]